MGEKYMCSGCDADLPGGIYPCPTCNYGAGKRPEHACAAPKGEVRTKFFTFMHETHGVDERGVSREQWTADTVMCYAAYTQGRKDQRVKLLKYCGHTYDCLVHAHKYSNTPVCDCGWRDLAAEIKGGG